MNRTCACGGSLSPSEEKVCRYCMLDTYEVLTSSRFDRGGNPLDEQEGGEHYRTMPIQPVEFIHRNGIGFMEGCAIKYLSRHGSKGGAEDVRKALHFCQLILKLEYGE